MATNPYTIDDYKAALGYGQRGNLFMVTLTLPAVITAPDVEQTFTIMCEKCNMPTSRELEKIQLPFMGDFVSVAGDKQAPVDLAFTFANTLDFKVRNRMELWASTIQQDVAGLRTTPDIYKGFVKVSALNNLKVVTKTYEYVGAYILTVEQLDFGNDTKEITKTNITMSYDYFRPVTI